MLYYILMLYYIILYIYLSPMLHCFMSCPAKPGTTKECRREEVRTARQVLATERQSQLLWIMGAVTKERDTCGLWHHIHGGC